MNKVKFVPLAIIVVALAASPFMSPRQVAGKPLGGRPLTAILSGAEEVNNQGDNNQGDLDGSGLADLTLNSGQEQICFELKVENIAAPIRRAHIHAAPAGVNGGIVVTFFDLNVNIPVPPDLEGCVDVDRDLVKEIRRNPANHYVNVHNDDFPPGAIRGQLFK